MSVKVWKEGQTKETEEEKRERLEKNEQYMAMPYEAKVGLARSRIWEWYDECRRSGKTCAVSVGGLDSITLLALARDELGDDISSYCLKKIKQCLHWLSPPSVPQFPEVPVVTRLF